MLRVKKKGKWGMEAAHRLAYKHFVGPIPEGKEMDHVCRVRHCCNPHHVRLVTRRENLMAPGSLAPTKAQAEQTKCKRGHDFDRITTQGRRFCRTCDAARHRAKRAGVPF